MCAQRKRHLSRRHGAWRSQGCARPGHLWRRSCRRPGPNELGPASRRHAHVHGQFPGYRAQRNARLSQEAREPRMEMNPKAAGFAPGRLERIADHLKRSYIDNGKIAGCQVAVTRKGHLAYFASLGQMDRERNKPMRDDAIFRIYSMTKPITSVALMTLYERGYFQLNDPVSRFFPSWRDHRVWVSGRGADMKTEAPTQPVTMRHMLSHTGGLTYGAALVALGAPDSGHPVDAAYAEVGVRRGAGETLTDFMEKLAKVPLRYQPGERWMYSLSTDVCGALVEKISGQRFDKYLAEHIFEPLGMKDTSFVVAPGKLPRFCANYRRKPDKTLELVDDPQTSTYLKEPSFFSGGGGLT